MSASSLIQRAKLVGLFAVLLPLMAACDTLMPPNPRLEQDVLEIKNKLNDSIDRQASTERQLSSLMGSVSDNLDKHSNMTSTAMDEMQRRITTLSDELDKLRGEVEALNVSLKEANSRGSAPSYSGAPGTISTDTTTSSTSMSSDNTNNGAAATTPPATSMTADQALAQATQLFNNGQYPQAREAYSQALSQNPTGSLLFDIQFGMGETCYKLNDLTGAQKSYNAAILADPKYPKAWDALDRLADIEIAQGDKARAIKSLEWIATKRPQYSNIESVKSRLAQLKGSDTPAGPTPQ